MATKAYENLRSDVMEALTRSGLTLGPATFRGKGNSFFVGDIRLLPTPDGIHLSEKDMPRLVSAIGRVPGAQIVQKGIDPYHPGGGKQRGWWAWVRFKVDPEKFYAGKSAKAAAVVEAAKAVGAPRVKAVDVQKLRNTVVGLAREIRSSLARGYVNITTVNRLETVLKTAGSQLTDAGINRAIEYAGNIKHVVMLGEGNQMRDVGTANGQYIDETLGYILGYIYDLK